METFLHLGSLLAGKTAMTAAPELLGELGRGILASWCSVLSTWQVVDKLSQAAHVLVLQMDFARCFLEPTNHRNMP
jgi:hypothetical protein